MTFDDLMKLPTYTSVLCADGKKGLLIRWWEPDSVGVHVPDEERIREIP